MKFKRNLLILSAILIGVLIVVIGCLPPPTTPPAEGDVPTNGTISVAAAAVTTNDTTPTLTLSSTGATYMAFSGNGTTWSSWVTYATTYSTFNITTGAGCTSGDGTKTVYAKYKNDNGESATKVHDSIILDTVKPTLLTAVYTDIGSGGTVNKDDKITFTFDDEMLTSTVTSSTVATNLLLSDSKSYGTSPAVSWDSTLKICTVTLGTSPTLVVGTTTVNPSSLVKDTAGNADASTAVTISGTVLSSVTISPPSKTYIEGVTTTTTFTAVAKNAAGTDITSLCTFAWSESGLGAISPTTGSSTVYTPAESGTGTNNITVSATYLGVTKTKIAIVTINPAAVSDTPDPTKLSVSARTNKAKYIDLPTGATVYVYRSSSYTPDSSETVATITDSDWQACSGTLSENDYIFFTLKDSNNMTSEKFDDGRIPAEPNPNALGEIQAVSTIKVTSDFSPTGNLAANDTLKLYVGGTLYGTATVGTDMTVIALAAGDVPRYTVTNSNGHESNYAADGSILILTDATADNNGGTVGTLETNDTITLTFDGDVNVKLPIYVYNISWVPTATSKFAIIGDTWLKNTDPADSTGVVLVARTVVDIADTETVDFNIKTDIPIVDAGGGNRVLPFAVGSEAEFDSSSF